MSNTWLLIMSNSFELLKFTKGERKLRMSQKSPEKEYRCRLTSVTADADTVVLGKRQRILAFCESFVNLSLPKSTFSKKKTKKRKKDLEM